MTRPIDPGNDPRIGNPGSRDAAQEAEPSTRQSDQAGKHGAEFEDIIRSGETRAGDANEADKTKLPHELPRPFVRNRDAAPLLPGDAGKPHRPEQITETGQRGSAPEALASGLTTPPKGDAPSQTIAPGSGAPRPSEFGPVRQAIVQPDAPNPHSTGSRQPAQPQPPEVQPRTLGSRARADGLEAGNAMPPSEFRAPGAPKFGDLPNTADADPLVRPPGSDRPAQVNPPGVASAGDQAPGEASDAARPPVGGASGAKAGSIAGPAEHTPDPTPAPRGWVPPLPGPTDPTGRLSAGPVHDEASEAAVRPATASHDIARPGLAVPDGIRPDIRSEEDKPAPPIPETMGNLILRSIQSAEPPPTVEGAPAPKTDIAETLQNVARQVLVTKSGADQAEVRIRLNANVLEGAEIVVNRDANGLNIKFEVNSFHAAQTIEAMRGQLQAQMQTKSGGDVFIQVEVDEQDSAGDTPQDGRSRNRHDPRDSEDEDQS